MLTNLIPAPTIFIDEIAEVSGFKGRAVIVLSSCGTPVRMTLSRHDLMKLGHWATKTAAELFGDDGAEIVKFPAKRRKSRSA